MLAQLSLLAVNEEAACNAKASAALLVLFCIALQCTLCLAVSQFLYPSFPNDFYLCASCKRKLQLLYINFDQLFAHNHKACRTT